MNGPSSLLIGLTFGAVFGSLPASAAAPVTALVTAPLQGDDQAALLADDLRFAESLAVSRFYDIADEVATNTAASIERLAKDNVELAGDASLVKARIAKRRSEATSDTEARLAALSEAITELKDWSTPGSDYAYLDRMVDALEDLAGALRERGTVLASKAAAGDATARADADRDFKEADEAYKALYKEAGDRAGQLEGDNNPDAAEAMTARSNTTYYLRGLNAVEWADVASDRDFRLEEAIDLLDEFMWEVSEDTLIYYSALYEQGRALAKLGEMEDARDILENVLELGEPAFWAYVGQGEYSPALERVIAGLFDSVWGYLALLDADEGNLTAAAARIDTMLAEHESKKVAMGRDGHRVLLDWAEKLNALGKTSDATNFAQRVAEEGGSTPEGGRAQRLLSEWVSGGAVTLSSPDALMYAASGYYTEKKYGDAAFFYQRAAALLSTPEERVEMAFNAWMGAGRSHQRSGRQLEAAIAYEEALTTADELHSGDIDKLEPAALLMYQAYAGRYTESQDAFDKRLRDAASQRIQKMGLELDVQFQKAEETFGECAEGDVACFLAALAEFEAVPESSSNYERSIVYAARCLDAAGRTDDALARYAIMGERAADSTLEPTNDATRNKREIALAQARYYHAGVLLREEVARPQEALTILEDFEADVPSQDSFHPRAKWQRVIAHAMAGDDHVEQAEAALQVLIDDVGEDQPSFISSGAFRVAGALKSASDSAAAAGDAATSRDLLKRAADAMWIYVEASGFSSFGNMLLTGEWYLLAGEPATAQRIFTKALEVHGDSNKLSDSDVDNAKMGLARAYDRQQDFARARVEWKQLLARNPRSVSIRLGAARSLGGWLEVDDSGQVIEIPGAGDYQEAHDIWVGLYKDARGSAKYTDMWWQAKLGTIDSWYRQRAADPEKGRQARQLLDQLRLLLPNYDEDTMEGLSEDLRYEPLYKPLFRYLERKLPAN